MMIKSVLSALTPIIIIMFIYYHVALGPNNTNEVLNLMWDYRSRWKFIGIKLGIHMPTLDAIEMNHRRVEDCLTELITTWLRGTNPKPTRSAITKVLESQSVVASATTPSEGSY
jgi:hypothetical protein